MESIICWTFTHSRPPYKSQRESVDFFIFCDIIFLKMKNYIDLSNAVYKDEFSSGIFPTAKTKDYQFECLNPLKTTSFAKEMGISEKEATKEQLKENLKTRKDLNVASMRNFIFECDETSLKEQLKRISFLAKNKHIVNRVVFSGNKSFHCRITINKDPEDISHYKWLWNKLNNKYFAGTADRACSNPSRLTRKPNGVRIKNGKTIVQRLVFEDSSNILDVSCFDIEWENEKSRRRWLELTKETHQYQREPKNALIINELESMSESSQEKEQWQRAWALAQNDGSLSYQEAASAVSYLGCLGYTADDIIQQIEFGKWNFKKEYIEKILERI